ncbi:ATP-binding protein [Candidatus Woesearchaeota archaeon]|nr:ATP-binding protein [Candidatus Woesearchaeota archaeon]
MVEYPLRFVRELQDDNPWWNGGRKPAPSFKRSDYVHFVREITDRGVHIVIGPRRVGKSSLLFQLINHLLENGVRSEHILYLSLERPYFDLLPNKIQDAVEYYETTVLQAQIGKGDRVYLFVDEAQYDPAWARLFKQYVEQNRNITAYISGSSAQALFKHAAESGAGRFHTHYMMTMKFRDVLRFRRTEQEEEIFRLSQNLRDALCKSIKDNDPPHYVKQAQQVSIKLAALRPEGILEEYLLKGGYPEMYSEKPWREVSMYYQINVFDKIIAKDVVNVFNIKQPDKVRSLLVQLLDKTAMSLERTKLAELINVKSKRGALDQYISALAEAFLIRTAVKYRKQRGRPSTKARKFFASDPGLRNVVLGVDHLTPEERGALMETVVFNHVLRLEYFVDRQVRSTGFYWSEDHERDIVLDTRKLRAVVPIEVKAGQADNHDAIKVRRTCSILKVPLGILIGGESISEHKGVISVPAWLFLLSC